MYPSGARALRAGSSILSSQCGEDPRERRRGEEHRLSLDTALLTSFRSGHPSRLPPGKPDPCVQHRPPRVIIRVPFVIAAECRNRTLNHVRVITPFQMPQRISEVTLTL